MSPHQIVGARVTGAFRASDSCVKFSQCAEAAGTSARRRTDASAQRPRAPAHDAARMPVRRGRGHQRTTPHGCQQKGSTEASELKSARRCTAHYARTPAPEASRAQGGQQEAALRGHQRRGPTGHLPVAAAVPLPVAALREGMQVGGSDCRWGLGKETKTKTKKKLFCRRGQKKGADSGLGGAA